MRDFRLLTSAALLVMITPFLLAGQTPPTGGAVSGRGQGAPVPAVRSPEVNADRSVMFRLRAPQAIAVELVGEVLQGKGPQPMTKGSDGVWSITIGPLPPEIWIYNFRIEGVDFPDPANISIMPRAAGTGAISSFVEVPAAGGAFYDSRPIPHGEVRTVLYRSKAMEVDFRKRRTCLLGRRAGVEPGAAGIEIAGYADFFVQAPRTAPIRNSPTKT